MKRVYVILALCAVLFAGWANLACDTPTCYGHPPGTLECR